MWGEKAFNKRMGECQTQTTKTCFISVGEILSWTSINACQSKETTFLVHTVSLVQLTLYQTRTCVSNYVNILAVSGF